VPIVAAITSSGSRGGGCLNNHERRCHLDIPWFEITFEYRFETILSRDFGFAAAGQCGTQLFAAVNFS